MPERYERQDYRDVNILTINPKDYDLVQLKYDGIWSLADLTNDKIGYYSRRGSLKNVDPPNQYFHGALVGEYMYGSEWALENNREGKFFAFDLVEINNECRRGYSYENRLTSLTEYFNAGLLPKNFELVKSFPIEVYLSLWETLVETGHFEGLVFRRLSDPWESTISRAKFSLEKDLYIIGYEEGTTGRLIDSLGALVAAENVAGTGVIHKVSSGLSDKLRKDIWRNKEKYLGKCFTVEAKKVFQSGQLRHPSFVRFHLEK